MDSLFRGLMHVLGVVGVSALLGSCSAPSAPAPLSSATPLKAQALTTYFVDNRSGLNCSNAGTGTSSSAPWCDFTPANARTYGPGDQILLARGASWNQQLTLNGSGSSSNYASLGAYGTGAKPKILRGGDVSARAVRMNNPSYWNVSNLEVGDAGAGILVHFTTPGHEGLNFSDLYVHGNSGIINGSANSTRDDYCSNTDDLWVSAGIAITGPTTLTVPNDQFILRNVTFSNIEGENNLDTIAVDWCTGQFFSRGTDTHHYTQNLVFNHIYSHDNDGAGIAGMCPDSFRLASSSKVTILNSRFVREAACFVSSGTAAIILVSVKDVTLVNSIVSDVPDTGSVDQTGIDHEVFTDGVKLRNLYIARNAGPGIEYLILRCNIGDFSKNHEVTGSMFVGNAVAGRGAYLGGISALTPCGQASSTVRDVLYSEPTGLLSGDTSQFVLSNNRALDSSSSGYYAAEDFSDGTQPSVWSYQTSNDGNTWSSLSYDSSAKVWKDNATVLQVSRFEIHPTNCVSCWVARAWTAPRTGVVQVRGRVLKSDLGGGDGVFARVTRNGTVIWGPSSVAYNDLSGLEANIDDLPVSAGDQLRFEVNAGASGSADYDTTSWSPAVGYTPYTPPNASLLNTSFESPATSGITYSPSGGTWTFNSSSGVQRNGSFFGAQNAPDGVQTAFLQGASNGLGSVAQTVTLAAGTYQLQFQAARRAGQVQPIRVSVDGTLVGALISPSSDSFTGYSSANFTVAAGAHTLKLEATDGSGDKTSFVDAVSVVSSSAPIFSNSGFETPATGGYQYLPTGAGWSFSGTASGVQRNGSAFGASNAPEGVQTAFLQGSDSGLGALSQSLNFSAGSYTVSFQAARRAGQVQPIRVSVDGAQVGGLILPSSDSFAGYFSASFTVNAGTHTVKLEATDGSGDKTSFVDSVSIQ